MGAILGAIEHEAGRGVQARMTNVAAKANIPYDRLQTYLDDLARGGFVEPSAFPRLTPRGREFLKHYREWTALLDRFGMGKDAENVRVAERGPRPARGHAIETGF